MHMCENTNGFSCVISIHDQWQGIASIFVFGDKMSLNNLGLHGDRCVSEAGLELTDTLLLQPPKYWVIVLSCILLCCFLPAL